MSMDPNDDDVFEIPPPPHQFKRKKQSTLQHDIIDIHDDDDSDDAGEKRSKRNKGKEIAAVYEDHQAMEVSDNNIGIVSDNFVDVDEYVLLLQSHFDSVDIPTGIEAPINLLPEVLNKTGNTTFSPWSNMLSNANIQAAPSKKNSATSQQNGLDLNLSLGKQSTKSNGKMKSAISDASKSDDVSDEIMRKFRSFKQFDIVEDASDHYFFRYDSSVKQNPEQWANAIQKDWKILEKDLPDSIFVRVYESRIDLLRAVIVGEEGTPYHDGLFFFDFCFPTQYPSEEPEVVFRSGCVSKDPSLLLENGFPRLGLISSYGRYNTKEKWIPNVSTMLHVLVSIQGYISNTKPYFDEAKWDMLIKMKFGRMHGKKSSLKYNQDTFFQSLRLMLNTVMFPPKYFEDFVVGHFRSRGHDILMACNAYMEGVPVGYVVKGGVQDVYQVNGSFSEEFNKSLAEIYEEACQLFFKVGATAYEKFLLTEKPKNDEILRKFRCFKQFDTVEDASDHYYFRYDSSMKQNPKKWVKAIQREWKILEKDLPDSILVRVYESRMDLMRAVIIGPEGTPYHDGLFFFDVHFPGSYPSEPPLVYYHTGGVFLNPNLFGSRVCLSLLNTWPSYNRNERWLPSVSTMLQVLVSIQGLILTAKPAFNSIPNPKLKDENASLKYNEEAFILSLRLMMFTITKPPKHFEDFVVGHFCIRGHDILMACKTYMEGVQVGYVLKGGVQDVEEGNGSCSQVFKKSLAGIFKEVCQRFCKCGAKDCEKFLFTGKAEK